MGSLCSGSSCAKNPAWNSFGNWLTYSQKSIYVPEEVARVFGARDSKVWEDTLLTYSGAVGYVCVGGGRPYKVKQGGNPDNCQGNRFLLVLMVV